MEDFPVIPKAANDLEIRTILQLPTKGSWFENIAVRASGQILITRLDVPELWTVAPETGHATVLLTFPEPSFRSVMGITELTPDLWAVGVGYYNHQTGGAREGSWEIWLVDLTGPDTKEPEARPLTKIPEAGMINGLTTWDARTVLAVDSMHGVIFRIDAQTGAYAVALSDNATMAPPPNAPVCIGINGVRVRDGFVYYTNTTLLGLFRIPVDTDLSPTGVAEKVATGLVPDDFCFDEDRPGVAYVTGNASNVVSKVVIAEGGDAVSTVETYVGDLDSLDMAGATAVALGRGEGDRRTLYIVTCGGSAMPVKGRLVEGAKLVAVAMV